MARIDEQEENLRQAALNHAVDLARDSIRAGNEPDIGTAIVEEAEIFYKFLAGEAT